MALETLQTLGSSASPCIQAISDFANTTTEDNLREIAYKTIGKINGDFRNTSPEIDQALKGEETMAYWNEKFANGNCGYRDLLDALREPVFAASAAKHLGEWGASAKNAVPDLTPTARDTLVGLDAARWAEILSEIEAWKPKIVVPGHGNVGGVEILFSVRNYITDLGKRVAAERKTGKDADAIVAGLGPKVRAEHPDWDSPEWIDFAIRYFSTLS
jgi:hypothetical protein